MSLSDALGPAHNLSQPPYVSTDDVDMPEDHVVPKAEHTKEDAEMEDLFGNDDDLDTKPRHGDDDDDMKGPSSAAPGSPLSSPQGSEDRQRRELEYEEPEDAADVAEEDVKQADVAFPNLPIPRSSDGNHWVIRLPNYVRMDSKPFHQDVYLGPEHDDEDTQADESLRERSMSIKLRVENTIRWRWAKDEFGQDVRQSNARIVRWSDGTMSLRLGKELFDISQTIDTSGAAPRGSQAQPPSQSQSQSQADAPAADGTRAQGLTYLVAQHKRAQLLQAEAAITGYLALRPTGMQSETHRMLVRAVGQKHNRVARLRMAPDPTVDPEREVAEIAKKAARRSKKREDGEDGAGRRRARARRRAAEWSDDDDEGGYGSEEEESARPRAKGRKEDAKADYEEDDFVVADSSDDDDDDDGAGKKRKRGRAEEEEEEEDPLDRMEAKLREQDKEERKKQKKSGERKVASFSSDAEGDAGMDIESEEDEDEEIKVRRAGGGGGGSGSRKKRAIDFDDDDDDEDE